MNADKVLRIAEERGFFWQSSEIYGGVAGFIDIGPLGVLLKNNIIEKWRKVFVRNLQDYVVEIETPIIMPSKVWVASGHVDHFTDFIVSCKACGRKYRADHLIEEETGMKGLEGMDEDDLTKIIVEKNIRCPACGGELDRVRKFNLLFKTTIGPYSENVGYARPEAAQGMFVNFLKVYEINRRRMPFGIAQVGRVMRNEISPRQGPIRLREFTIMEIEFFFDPENPSCPLLDDVRDTPLRILTAENYLKGGSVIEISLGKAIEEKIILTEWNAYFMALATRFLEELGIGLEDQMFLEKPETERAHYALQTFDQMVRTEKWGWVEVSGHAYRTDYDVRRHMEYSGKDLRAYRQLPEPKIVEKMEVRIKADAIKRSFGPRASDVFRIISRMGLEELGRKIEERGFIILGDFRLTGEHVEIIRKKERIGVERFVPHVAEPSFGTDRIFYVTLEHAYREKEGRPILSLPPDIAPVKAAVFPLVRKDELVKTARTIYRDLISRNLTVIYDDEGSIGRRYARVDEIGVPFSITVDYQTIEDGTVTIRNRDTWEQERMDIRKAVEYVVNKTSI